MCRAGIHASLMLSAAFAASCPSSLPPARIGDYLASGRQADVGAFTKIDQRPLQAGLVVVSDTAEPDAAPNLPEEALVRLGENLQRDLGRAIPVAITAVISTDRIRPEMHGDWAQFAERGGCAGWTIWPPSYEGASNTLRVVSFEQAGVGTEATELVA